MKNNMRYSFRNVSSCNMCGRDTQGNTIIGIRLNRSQGLWPKYKAGIAVSVVRCKDCGLIYASPLPVPFDISDHYDIPPEEYWKKERLNIDEEVFQGEITKAKELLLISPDMKALDIGAGIGKSMNALSKSGFDTYGIEPSSAFRDRAVEYLGIDASRLRHGKLEDIDYDECFFDFITFGAVLEHIYDPDEALRKALRWLKPNGIIHIEVPSSDWLIARLVNRFYWLTASNYVTNISPMHEPYHLYEFTLDSFNKNSSKNKYEVAYHQYYICMMPYIPKILKPIFRWYMGITDTGMQLAVWLRKQSQ